METNMLHSVKVLPMHHRYPTSMCCICLRRETYVTTSRRLSVDTANDTAMLGKHTSQQTGTTVAKVLRDENVSLGISMSGGCDKRDNPSITFVQPGSVADRTDSIVQGDRILSINGISVKSLKHQQITDLIRNAKSELCMELEYILPDFPPQPSIRLERKRMEIELIQEANSLGISLRGGAADCAMKSRPLTIVRLRPGSPADRDGRLQPSDRVLAISGRNMSTYSCADALEYLQHFCGNRVKLLVEYDASIVDRSEVNAPSYVLEITKSPSVELGVTLGQRAYDHESVIYVREVRRGSVADRSGAIKAGDTLITVSGIDVSHMTVPEATYLIQHQSESSIRLEISPHNPNDVSFTNDTSDMMVSSAYEPTGLLSSSIPDGNHFQRTRRSLSQPSLRKSNGSLASSIVVCNQVVCREERIRIELSADYRGSFGFTLKNATNPSSLMTQYPAVDFVENGTAAYRCGVIMENDKLVSINGLSTIGRSLDEVNTYLVSTSHCVFEFLFTVSDITVPSEGTFVVQLFKRSEELGVTLKSPICRTSLPYLLISSIKCGSVAFRSGAICVGDKLLEIDGTPVISCTLENAVSLLAGTDRIIRLKVQKEVEETSLKLPQATSEITEVFSVHLERADGQLGLTIVATGHDGDHVRIQSIADGTPAHRCRKMRPGDFITAINNHYVADCQFVDVLELLQCEGTITILLKRITEQPLMDDPESTDLKLPIPTHTRTRPRVRSKKATYAHSRRRSEEKSSDSAVDMLDIITTESDSDSRSRSSSSPRMRRGSGAGANKEANHSGARPPPASSSARVRANLDRLIEESTGSGGGKGACTTSSDQSSMPCYVPLRSAAPINYYPTVVPAKTRHRLTEYTHPLQDGGVMAHSVVDQTRPPIQRSSSSVSAGVNFSRSEQNMHMEVTANRGVRREKPARSLSRRRLASGGGSRSGQAPGREVVRVTLFKLASGGEAGGFGLALSESVDNEGVYVTDIKPDSPADKCGLIERRDRLLQVNGKSTKLMDCDAVVNLMTHACDQIELVLLRRKSSCNNSTTSVHFQDGSDYEHDTLDNVEEQDDDITTHRKYIENV